MINNEDEAKNEAEYLYIDYLAAILQGGSDVTCARLTMEVVVAFMVNTSLCLSSNSITTKPFLYSAPKVTHTVVSLIIRFLLQ